MRVNVYSQELTDEAALIRQGSNTGITYSAIRLFLHSSDRLHCPPEDDDRSAITFWLPKSTERRRQLAETFANMAEMCLTAPPEDGLD